LLPFGSPSLRASGKVTERRGEYRKAQVVALQNRGAIPYRELTASSCRNGQLLEIDMRTIVSALIALSVLAGIAASASAKSCPPHTAGDPPNCKPIKGTEM
jgi:hypothetical protein